MTDYSAGAPRAALTASSPKVVYTPARPDTASAARPPAASAPGIAAARQVAVKTAVPVPVVAAGSPRSISTPARPAPGSTSRSYAGAPPGITAARANANTVVAVVNRVWPTGAYVRPVSTLTRLPAAATARGDSTGSAVVRPTVGQLWPRARAAA